MKLKILLLTALVCAAGRIHAGPPGTAFTYQGVLSGGGSPATGTFDFQFSLYDAAASGNQVGSTLTNTGVSVNNGTFQVTLDFGTNAFNGSARWLSMGLRTSGGAGAYTLQTPLQQLTPAPYAMYAASAGVVVNGSVSAAQLNITGASPTAGQVLSYNGTSLVWTSPSSGGGGGGWSLNGNAGTSPAAGNFLGTMDSAGLELRVNSLRGMGLDYASRSLTLGRSISSINVSGGFWGNSISSGVVGGTIAGGGYGILALPIRTTFPNSVTADFGTVGGGSGNSSGNSATVGGGEGNAASGPGAFVGGGGFDGTSASGNNAFGGASTVAGGLGNFATTNYATVGGGATNISRGFAATVAGGIDNYSGANYATVGGGQNNQSSGEGATVGGGLGNSASARGATAGGGTKNVSSGEAATVGGGLENVSSGVDATVGGGDGNISSGSMATVPGGRFNLAEGDESFAAGTGAQALHKGSFVWADSQTPLSFDSTASDQVSFRCQGGARFLSNLGGTDGVELAPNATSWNGISDRNVKKNFQPADTVSVLEKLAAIPIQKWNYKWEKDSDVPNIGPMAQDFKGAFYPGRDDKHISTLEFDGVELAAIQGLNLKLEKAIKVKDARIAQLEKKLSGLESAQRQTAADWEARFNALQTAIAHAPDKPAASLAVESDTLGAAKP